MLWSAELPVPSAHNSIRRGYGCGNHVTNSCPGELLLQGDDNCHQVRSEQGIWDAVFCGRLGAARALHLSWRRCKSVSVNASKEYGLEKALAKMHADWDGLEFRIIEYKDTGTYIVGGTDEIQVTSCHAHMTFLPVVLTAAFCQSSVAQHVIVPCACTEGCLLLDRPGLLSLHKDPAVLTKCSYLSENR